MLLRKIAAVAAGAVLLVLAGPGVALAHVTVSPGTAEPGSYVKESFRVPNEKSTASTVQLEVVFPLDHPVPSTAVAPVPGWTSTVSKKKLPAPVKTPDGELTEAVSSIVWKGGSIEPGQFVEFSVTLGPLPKNADRLVFKALQTYSDGDVVRWIDVPQDGQPELDHPAPVLELKAAAAPVVAPAAQGDTFARVLGSVGALAGLLALAWTVIATRRPAAPATPVDEPSEDRVKVHG